VFKSHDTKSSNTVEAAPLHVSEQLPADDELLALDELEPEELDDELLVLDALLEVDELDGEGPEVEAPLVTEPSLEDAPLAVLVADPLLDDPSPGVLELEAV
jgi:hypothetical protein